MLKSAMKYSRSAWLTGSGMLGRDELGQRADRLQRAAVAKHVSFEQLHARADRFSDFVFERDDESDDAERIERAAGPDDDGVGRLVQPLRRRQLLVHDVDGFVDEAERLFMIHHGWLAAGDFISPPCRAVRIASSWVSRITRFERILICANTYTIRNVKMTSGTRLSAGTGSSAVLACVTASSSGGTISTVIAASVPNTKITP